MKRKGRPQTANELSNLWKLITDGDVRPQVFISCTTQDLGPARGQIDQELQRMGFHAVYKETFDQAPEKLTKIVRAYLGRCDGVIHIPGYVFGKETPRARRPKATPAGWPERISFTQLEYLIAVLRGLPVYAILAEPNLSQPQPEEVTDGRAQLQIAHRGRVTTREQLHWTVTNRTELLLEVNRLNLEPVRRRCLRRLRRKLRACNAAALLLLLAGTSAFTYQAALNTWQKDQRANAATFASMDSQRELRSQVEQLRTGLASARLAQNEMQVKLLLAEANYNRSEWERHGQTSTDWTARTGGPIAALSMHQSSNTLERLESLLRERLWLNEQVHGLNDESLATALCNLASLVGTRGRSEEAETLFERSLAIQRKNPQQFKSIYAGSLASLAHYKAGRSQPTEAIALAKEALDFQTKTAGPNDQYAKWLAEFIAKLEPSVKDQKLPQKDEKAPGGDKEKSGIQNKPHPNREQEQIVRGEEDANKKERGSPEKPMYERAGDDGRDSKK